MPGPTTSTHRRSADGRKIRFIGGLWVEGHADATMEIAATGASTEAHVTVHGVTSPEVIAALSPDDADRLADDLRAAAKAARGEEP